MAYPVGVTYASEVPSLHLLPVVPHQKFASPLRRAFLPAFFSIVDLIRIDLQRGRSSPESGGSATGNAPARKAPSKRGLAALELCREVVTMVQSAEAGPGMNPVADYRTTLDRAPRWGVFRQPQMRPILVVIADILSHEPLQMPFIEDNHVIQQVSAATSNPALGDAVLPRAAEGCANWLAPQVLRGRDDIAAKF